MPTNIFTKFDKDRIKNSLTLRAETLWKSKQMATTEIMQNKYHLKKQNENIAENLATIDWYQF